MIFAQFAFLVFGMIVVALLAFTLLVIFEQLRICLSNFDKIIALISAAFGFMIGTQILIGYPISLLLLMVFMIGGAVQIWCSTDRSQ